MPKVRVHTGVEIYYEEHGSGPPLLLIPGLSWGAWSYAALFPELSTCFHLIAIDNRGVGQSEVPPGPYSITGMADDAAGVLDALGIARAHVLGASMGGFISQEFALNHPEKVDRLVLMCTAPGGPEMVSASPDILQLLAPDPALSPEAAAWRVLPALGAPGFYEGNPEEADMLVQLIAANKPPLAGVMGQLGAIMSWPGTGRRLRELMAPTLIIHGDSDILVPTENGRRLAGLIPGARLELLPGSGHVFPLRDQPVLTRLILEHLA